MTEREALLAAVCENPDDDTPRLVFADWLDENGEPERAEFIRVQIEAKRVGLNSVVGQELFFRERELLRAHEVTWRSSLPEAFGEHPFVRGFVEAASVGERRPISVTELEPLFPASPLIDLTIYQLGGPGMLARVPAMSRIRKLTIGLLSPTEESLESFMTETDLGSLKSLLVFDGGGVIWPPYLLRDSVMMRFQERFKGVFVEPPGD